MSEIDDLERTLIHVPDFVPGVDANKRSKLEQMRKAFTRRYPRNTRLQDELEALLRDPPE